MGGEPTNPMALMAKAMKSAAPNRKPDDDATASMSVLACLCVCVHVRARAHVRVDAFMRRCASDVCLPLPSAVDTDDTTAHLCMCTPAVRVSVRILARAFTYECRCVLNLDGWRGQEA